MKGFFGEKGNSNLEYESEIVGILEDSSPVRSCHLVLRFFQYRVTAVVELNLTIHFFSKG